MKAFDNAKCDETRKRSRRDESRVDDMEDYQRADENEDDWVSNNRTSEKSANLDGNVKQSIKYAVLFSRRWNNQCQRRNMIHQDNKKDQRMRAKDVENRKSNKTK